jgi:glutamine---fructose-6-phosphate transaminase (isomerizing)
MLDDILDQPRAIRETLSALSKQMTLVEPLLYRVKQGGFRKVVMTGMGGSLHVCHAAWQRAACAGLPVMCIESSELLRGGMSILDDQTLLIAVSQSGESVEVVRLVEALRSHLTVIGVTNTPGSTLERLSSVSLVMRAGPEQSVSTKTWTCTAAVLHVLARGLVGTDTHAGVIEAARAGSEIEKRLPEWRERATEIAAKLRDTRFVTCVGRGPSRATAMSAALVIKETAKLPTEGMAGGQFRHGPVEAAGPGHTLMIFSSEGETQPLNIALANHAMTLGMDVVWIGFAAPAGTHAFVLSPGLDDYSRIIAETVPAQVFAAALATERGFTPGVFRNATKVTTIE